jgi:hypothetical protein
MELQTLQLEIVISEDAEREAQRKVLQVRHGAVLAANPCCWGPCRQQQNPLALHTQQEVLTAAAGVSQADVHCSGKQ